MQVEKVGEGRVLDGSGGGVELGSVSCGRPWKWRAERKGGGAYGGAAVLLRVGRPELTLFGGDPSWWGVYGVNGGRTGEVRHCGRGFGRRGGCVSCEDGCAGWRALAELG